MLSLCIQYGIEWRRNCTHKLNLIAKPSSFSFNSAQPSYNEIIDPVSESGFGTRLKLREPDLNSFPPLNVRGLRWYASASDRHQLLSCKDKEVHFNVRVTVFLEAGVSDSPECLVMVGAKLSNHLHSWLLIENRLPLIIMRRGDSPPDTGYILSLKCQVV